MFQFHTLQLSSGINTGIDIQYPLINVKVSLESNEVTFTLVMFHRSMF